MKRVTAFLALASALSGTNAYWKGFNIKSYQADGTTCKTASDWANAFHTLTTLPNKINSARLYYSSACDTLTNAVPAAISAGLFLLVGVNPESQFEEEKAALQAAVQRHGWDWIVSVSVGSEDLYRGTTNATTLARQINEVRDMLSGVSGYSPSIKVGHVDTTNAWTNRSNAAVIQACDFVGTDIYPYFQDLQNNSIENADDLFWNGVKEVREAVADAGRDTSVWVTESGWPVNGTTKNLAVADTKNAKSYWKSTACSAFQQINVFWFTLQDWSAYPSFAVLDPDSNWEFDLSC